VMISFMVYRPFPASVRVGRTAARRIDALRAIASPNSTTGDRPFARLGTL
jgi:hypothetical protein